MSNGANITDSQQVLEQIARAGSPGRSETSVVASPGARVNAWAVKIKSLSSYNIYDVRTVEIGQFGRIIYGNGPAPCWNLCGDVKSRR